jgi:hypothetical protein
VEEILMKTSKWILVTPSLFVAVLNGIAIDPPAPARLFDRGLFDTDGLTGGSTVLLVYADDQGIILIRRW